MKSRVFAAVAALAGFSLIGAGALWAQQASWIHVHVEKQEGENVRVNVPLALARVALEVLPEAMLEKAVEGLKEKQISVEDLRRMWNELRQAGDAELVSVESAEESVKVARQGGLLRVDVRKLKEGEQESVRIELPVAAVDALFSGEGETLNLPAAIAQLEQHRGEIVDVEERGERVRIWIDSNS